MSQYVIEGGHPVSGDVQVMGNKNAILPMIAASVLTTETVVLENVPDIVDVRTMLEILEDVGAEIVRDFPNHRISICCKHVRDQKLDARKTCTLRASIYFMGTMPARFGRVIIDQPCGC